MKINDSSLIKTILSISTLLTLSSPALAEGINSASGLEESQTATESTQQTVEASSVDILALTDEPAEAVTNSNLLSENTMAGNCQGFSRDSIILSGSTAIFVEPLQTIKVRPEMPSQSVILTLAAPLYLTEDCVLESSSAYLEAQLEITENGEGFTIKTQSIIVAGHYLPLTAQSNVILFSQQDIPATGQPVNDYGVCGFVSLLPNLLLDANELDADIALNALGTTTNSVCQSLFREPSYYLEAEIKTDNLYNLRLTGLQTIPVPPALRTYSTAE